MFAIDGGVDEAAASPAQVKSDNLAPLHGGFLHVVRAARSSIARAAPPVTLQRSRVPLVVSADHGERVVAGLERGAVSRKPVRRNRRSSERSSSIVPGKVFVEPASRAGGARARSPARARRVRRASLVCGERSRGRALRAPAQARVVAHGRSSGDCSTRRVARHEAARAEQWEAVRWRAREAVRWRARCSLARKARAGAARARTDGDHELQVRSLRRFLEHSSHIRKRAALLAHVAAEVARRLLATRGRRRQLRQAELLAPGHLGVAARREVADPQLRNAAHVANMVARIRPELQEGAARVRPERNRPELISQQHSATGEKQGRGGATPHQYARARARARATGAFYHLPRAERVIARAPRERACTSLAWLNRPTL